MRILNLTQHAATAEQVTSGVIEPDGENYKKLVRDLITFDELPNRATLKLNANGLGAVALAHRVSVAMIGGAPFFMPVLEQALVKFGIRPVYAFSKRESVEEKQGGGSVKKTQVFRHAGFVDGPEPREPAPRRAEIPAGTEVR